MKFTEQQQKIWEKTLDDVAHNAYDFIYFIDVLEINGTSHNDYCFTEILNDFRNDSRKLMGMWLKSMWEREL